VDTTAVVARDSRFSVTHAVAGGTAAIGDTARGGTETAHEATPAGTPTCATTAGPSARARAVALEQPTEEPGSSTLRAGGLPPRAADGYKCSETDAGHSFVTIMPMQTITRATSFADSLDKDRAEESGEAAPSTTTSG